MKLKDMSDRELIMYLIGEVRRIKQIQRYQGKLLSNHLQHVWQVVIALVGIAGVAVTSLLIALLA